MRASWETERRLGDDVEEVNESVCSVYFNVTVRGKQACDQTLRRSSGASFEKM